jgi:SAM-dependent methyltransferase
MRHLFDQSEISSEVQTAPRMTNAQAIQQKPGLGSPPFDQRLNQASSCRYTSSPAAFAWAVNPPRLEASLAWKALSLLCLICRRALRSLSRRPAWTSSAPGAKIALSSSRCRMRAASFGQRSRLIGDITEQVMQRAGVRPRMSVLDCGCGVGDVSFLIARLVGSAGRVLGIDRSGY